MHQGGQAHLDVRLGNRSKDLSLASHYHRILAGFMGRVSKWRRLQPSWQMRF